MGGPQVERAWLAELEVRARSHLDSLSPTASDTDRLVHELQVHRIELEMQNEEMMRSQDAVEKTCERYQALLTAAPLGYLALDANGRIRDVNPLGARLLGLQSAELLDKHLQAFLRVADADHFHLRLSECLSTTTPQVLSVAMALEEQPAHVRLQIVPNANDDGAGPSAWVFMVERSQLVEHHEAQGTAKPRGDDLRPLAQEGQSEDSHTRGGRAANGRVVLVVDDDPTVLRAVSRILRSEGYNVVAVSSGAEALDVARREDQRLDILLSDVRMPAMDGGELGQHMARIRPAMPRVYMSGDIGDVVLEPGAILVAKPFRPDTLVRLLEQRMSMHALVD